MASTMSRDSYTFRAEPKAVKNRPKYRKEGMALGNSNLMSDKRVLRGNTYSRKPQPTTTEQAGAPVRRPRTPTRQHVQQQEMMRVPTPEPVPGRVHMSVQTDNYLEDLRERVREHDFGTQTDPELDYPEKPLFVPQSSGVDMFTFIEEGDLFDFDMEVEPILHVITGKSLDQALLEVLEEEEMKEMLEHREAFSQLRNAKLAELQRLEAKDTRFEEEKLRRIAQAKLRVQEQAQFGKERAAATLAKEFYMDLQNTIISKMASDGFFYDPALKQIQGTFLPWLVKKVDEKMKEKASARRAVDQLIDGAAQLYQNERGHKILDIMDTIQSRELIREEIGRRKVEAEAARRAAAAAEAAARAAKIAAGGDPDEDPEDEDNGDEDGDEGDNDGEDAEKKPEEEEPKDEEPELVIPKLSILGQAFEFGEEDARRKFRGAFGTGAKGGDNFANVPDSVLVNNKDAKNILDEAHNHEADLRIAGLETDLGMEIEDLPGGGVYVSKVTALGSANHATIVQGDVISTFNDANVTSREHFVKLASSMPPGELATLSVTRGTDGRAEILSLEAFVQNQEKTKPHEVRQSRKHLGLSVSTSTLYTNASALLEITRLPASLGLTAEGEPAVVKDLHGESPASRAGVNEGDILVSFGGVILQSAAELANLLQGARPGDWVKLAVERDGERQVVDVELAAPGETIEKVRSLRLMAGTLEDAPPTYKGFNDTRRPETRSQLTKRELQDPEHMAKALEEVQGLSKEFGFVFEHTEAGVAIKEVNQFLAIQATLSEGDIILEVDDKAVNSADDLARLVDGMLAGDVVKVKVQRSLDGAPDLVALEITSGVIGPKEVRELRIKAGLTVNEQEIETPESALQKLQSLTKKFGLRVLDKDGAGVEIVEVKKNGVVEKSGAILGDVIHHVNGNHVVTDVQSFIAVTPGLLAGDTVTLHVTRTDPVSGESQEVELKTEVGAGEAQIRPEWVRALRKIANMSVFSR